MFNKSIFYDDPLIQLGKKVAAHNPTWGAIFNAGLPVAQSGICQQCLSHEEPIIDLAFASKLDQPAVKVLFSSVQRIIRTIIGDNHYYTPENSYHLTVYGHMYAGSTPTEFRNCAATPETITTLLPTYIDSAKNLAETIINNTTVIPMLYKYVLVTRDSVIAVADDGYRLNDLRLRIVAYGNQQGIYNSRDINDIYPNIAHSTLVRFLTPITKNQIEELYSQLPMALDMKLDLEEIQCRRFYQFGVWPKDEPLFSVHLQK